MLKNNMTFNIRFILGLLGTIIISLITAWLAIFNGCEFHDYQWVWSNNNLILAWQYLLNFLWAIIFVISPLWWLGLSFLGATWLLPKNIK